MVWLVGVIFLAAVASAFMFPRPVVALLAVLVLFVGGVLTYAVYDMTTTRSVRTLLSAEVVFDKAKCGDAAKPIGVTLTNRTGKTVTSVYFDIEAFRPGHSREVLMLPSQISDRILADGETWTACLGSVQAPPPGIALSDLDWTAKVTSLTYGR